MPGWNYPGRAYPGQSIDSKSKATGTGSFDAPAASFEGAGVVRIRAVRVLVLPKRIRGTGSLAAPAPTIRAAGRVRNRIRGRGWIAAPAPRFEGLGANDQLGAWVDRQIEEIFALTGRLPGDSIESLILAEEKELA
jgi:hypothetical protein